MRDENVVGTANRDPAGLKHHSKTDRKLLFLGVVMVLISGCGKTRYTQCEQIFQIANRLSQNVDRLSYFDNQRATEMKSWLEAASKIDRAANHLEALQINDSQLIEYQNKFVTVYRIYSQATYDAVKARENQNFQALKSAKNDAQKAGQIQQDLIEEINAYCLNI